MEENKKTEASGILDIILVFAAGAVGFVIINGLCLLLTSKPFVHLLVFLISAFVCFVIWPMDRAIESDLKEPFIKKEEENGK